MLIYVGLVRYLNCLALEASCIMLSLAFIELPPTVPPCGKRNINDEINIFSKILDSLKCVQDFEPLIMH